MANEKRLIDMDDTMNKLRAYAERKHEAEHYELANGILKAVNYIRNNIVRVNAVEVVHGRWLDVKETEVYSPDHRCTFTHTAETCSNCNVRIGFIGSKQYLYDNQCPNCGAKMDGEKDA